MFARRRNGAQRQRQAEQRHRPQQGDEQKDVAPADQFGQKGAERNTERDGQRHAAIDDGNSQAAAFFRHQPHRGGGGLRGVTGRAQCRQHSAERYLQVAGSPGAGQVAGDEQHQRQLQDVLAVDVAQQPGGQRRKQHVGQREYRYQLPRLRGADGKCRGNVAEHAGDDKGVGADGEGAGRHQTQRDQMAVIIR